MSSVKKAVHPGADLMLQSKHGQSHLWLGSQEPTVPGKECRRCNTFKQATDFYRNKTNPDGLYNNCKACFASDAWNR